MPGCGNASQRQKKKSRKRILARLGSGKLKKKLGGRPDVADRRVSSRSVLQSFPSAGDAEEEEDRQGERNGIGSAAADQEPVNGKVGQMDKLCKSGGSARNRR